MKIFIGSDHTGFELKKKIISSLKEEGYNIEDKGPYEYDGEDDYPDFVIPTAEAVAENTENFGIVIGGSGQGEAFCANKVKGARAVLFYSKAIAVEAVDIEGNKSTDPFEIVRLTRTHNNANILSLGVRFLSTEDALTAVKIFLSTPFEGAPRHKRRIDKVE